MSYEVNLDTIDPVTGLTPREKREVAESWVIFKKDIKRNAEELLVRFCIKYPYHHAKFGFGDVPGDRLRGNKKLQAHANSVAYALSAVVDNLNDTACLIDMLLRLGAFHATKNVPEQGFKDLKLVLLELMQERLGNKLTPSGLQSWDKTMNMMYAVLFRGMSQAHEEGKTHVQSM